MNALLTQFLIFLQAVAPVVVAGAAPIIVLIIERRSTRNTEERQRVYTLEDRQMQLRLELEREELEPLLEFTDAVFDALDNAGWIYDTKTMHPEDPKLESIVEEQSLRIAAVFDAPSRARPRARSIGGEITVLFGILHRDTPKLILQQQEYAKSGHKDTAAEEAQQKDWEDISVIASQLRKAIREHLVSLYTDT